MSLEPKCRQGRCPSLPVRSCNARGTTCTTARERRSVGGGAPPGDPDGVGQCPQRQTQQWHVFEQELAGEGQGREAAAGQLTYPGVVNRKLVVFRNSTMAIRLPMMDSFGATGLMASSSAAVTSKTPHSTGERIHREQLVEPAQERAVRHKWLNLVCLVKRWRWCRWWRV